MFGSAAALVLLAVALVLAWRRSRRPAEESPPRILRILAAAAGFASATTLLLLVDQLLRYPADPEMVLMAAVALVVFTLTGLALFGLADFWLGLPGPRRSPSWLVAAITAFALLVVGAQAAALAIGGVPVELADVATLQFAAVGAIAGISWWSFLPPPRRQVADRFD